MRLQNAPGASSPPGRRGATRNTHAGTLRHAGNRHPPPLIFTPKSFYCRPWFNRRCLCLESAYYWFLGTLIVAMPDRDRRLVDVGSTTALSAMVEILESRRSGGSAKGVLTRQAKAMLARLDPGDRDKLIEGFCDELQSFLESVPGMRGPFDQPVRNKRI